MYLLPLGVFWKLVFVLLCRSFVADIVTSGPCTQFCLISGMYVSNLRRILQFPFASGRMLRPTCLNIAISD